MTVSNMVIFGGFVVISIILVVISIKGWIKNEALNRFDKIASILSFISGIVFFALTSTPTGTTLTSTSTGTTFQYTIQIESKQTKKAVENAEVWIAMEGGNLSGNSDMGGFATIFIPNTNEGRVGRIIIDADGFDRYTIEVTLASNQLPVVATLEPSTDILPSSQATPTVSPVITINGTWQGEVIFYEGRGSVYGILEVTDTQSTGLQAIFQLPDGGGSIKSEIVTFDEFVAIDNNRVCLFGGEDSLVWVGTLQGDKLVGFFQLGCEDIKALGEFEFSKIE